MYESLTRRDRTGITKLASDVGKQRLKPSWLEH